MLTLKNIIRFLLAFLICILLYGLYSLYNVFYPNYFNGSEYTQTAFLGDEASKLQVLLLGFYNFKIILAACFVSIIFVLVGNIKRR